MENKKLTRSNNRMLAGVCAGLADYFGWDVTVVRIIYSFATVFTLLLIFSGQLLALIVCIMTGASGSIMAVRKDPYTRISVVTQIGNMIKFRRTQQNFRYVYKSPWEQS